MLLCSKQLSTQTDDDFVQIGRRRTRHRIKRLPCLKLHREAATKGPRLLRVCSKGEQTSHGQICSTPERVRQITAENRSRDRLALHIKLVAYGTVQDSCSIGNTARILETRRDVWIVVDDREEEVVDPVPLGSGTYWPEPTLR